MIQVRRDLQKKNAVHFWRSRAPARNRRTHWKLEKGPRFHSPSQRSCSQNCQAMPGRYYLRFRDRKIFWMPEAPGSKTSCEQWSTVGQQVETTYCKQDFWGAAKLPCLIFRKTMENTDTVQGWQRFKIPVLWERDNCHLRHFNECSHKMFCHSDVNNKLTQKASDCNRKIMENR